jgi:hypothetical protein
MYFLLEQFEENWDEHLDCFEDAPLSLLANGGGEWKNEEE